MKLSVLMALVASTQAITVEEKTKNKVAKPMANLIQTKSGMTQKV